MLKKLEKKINRWKSISTSFVGITGGFLLRLYIFENEGSNIFTYIGIAVVIGLCTFGVSDKISSWIENSKWIRRRILGNNFIEGHWIQNIESESYDLMHTVQYSVLKITFEKSSLKVEGLSFELDGSKSTASFHSDSTEFDGKILRYPFTVESLEFKNKKSIFGKTELHFEKIGKRPQKFFGVVESNVREHPVKVRGEKIKDNFYVDVYTRRGREKLISYINNR